MVKRQELKNSINGTILRVMQQLKEKILNNEKISCKIIHERPGISLNDTCGKIIINTREHVDHIIISHKLMHKKDESQFRIELVPISTWNMSSLYSDPYLNEELEEVTEFIYNHIIDRLIKDLSKISI